MINLSVESLRAAAEQWPAQDKEILEKRLAKREQADLLDVYKLFMPWAIEDVLLLNGYEDLVRKWELLIDRENSFEDGSHEKYLAWYDKSLKDALRAE